jgi:hypothetical protein
MRTHKGLPGEAQAECLEEGPQPDTFSKKMRTHKGLPGEAQAECLEEGPQLDTFSKKMRTHKLIGKLGTH